MARSGRARRRLNPLLCGCLSLGPPADVHIAPLLQECGAWETVPALVTIRMMTLLTRNDSTHSALLPTTPLICPPTYRFGCPRPCPRQCPQRARRDSRRGQQGGPVSGGPRVAPAGGEQSRAESLTLVGRCGGITQPVGPRSLRCSAASSSSVASQGISTSLEGQPRVECRKTCARGDKRTEIIQMSYSTPKLGLWQGLPTCPFNGRFPLLAPGTPSEMNSLGDGAARTGHPARRTLARGQGTHC